MSKTLGIDLGTSTTFIYLQGKGIVVRESTAIAIEASTLKVVATGTDARTIMGRIPGSITVKRPCIDGSTDYNATVELMTSFFDKMKKNGIIVRRPNVVCSVSCGADDDERGALEDALTQAGCKKVTLIDKPYAAALGAKLDISRSRPVMIADIGGGATEIAVFSGGDAVNSVSINIGGRMFSNALAAYIRGKYNLFISNDTAELLKTTYGTVNEKHDRGNAVVHGRNYSTGLPATIELSSPEIRRVLSRQIIKIAEQLLITLDETGEEYVETVVDDGITISGGSAMLDGMDILLSEYMDISVKMAVDPQDCIVEGLGMLIDSDNI